MRVKLFSIIFTFLFFIAHLTSFSQPGNGNGAPHPCPPNNPNCQPERVPISGSILLLLAGGISIGIRAITKKKKKD